MFDERIPVPKLKVRTTVEFGFQIEKFRQRMVVNNFSEHTILGYVAAIKRLHQYYNCPLESLQDENLIGFVCSLKEDHGLSISSMRIAVGAIKYFYKHILDTEAHICNIPYPKKGRTLECIPYRERN